MNRDRVIGSDLSTETASEEPFNLSSNSAFSLDSAPFCAQILSLCPVPFAIARVRDGRILYANEHFHDLFDISSEHPPHPPSLEDFFEPMMWQLLCLSLNQTGFLGNCELQLKTVKGKPVWSLVSLQVFPDSDEELLIGVFQEIAAQKQTEQILQESQRALFTLIRHLPGTIYHYRKEPDWILEFASEGCETLTGYKRETLLGNCSFLWQRVIHPADFPNVRDTINQKLEQQETYRVEYRIRTKSGAEKWVLDKGQGIFDEAGQIVGREGLMIDITERKQSEEALRQAEIKYRSIFENSVEGIFQTTPNGQFLSANPALARIYGYDSVENLMNSLTDIEHQLYVEPSQRAEFIRLMQENDSVTEFEAQVYQQDGTAIWIAENARSVRDDDGTLIYYEGTVEDITERKQVKEQLRQRAFYDTLTGLPNRALFLSRLSQALGQSRDETTPDRIAVLFLDLDRFKIVNDSLGHLIGDRLLVAISRRIEHCLRDRDTVARLGGDEFTILLEGIANIQAAIDVAERIIGELKAPFNLNGHQVFTGTSIGIVYYEPPSWDSRASEYERPEDLLRDADTALYRAKALGKGRYEIFNTEMRRNALRVLQLETELRQALEREELEIHYQPIVSLKTGKLKGFEGLLRWRHQEKGLVYPNAFMEIAEESGLILPIGSWLLRKVCHQLCHWQQLLYRQERDERLMVHINLSSKQFLQPDLLDRIDRIFAETGVDGSSLRWEIAESLWLQNADSTKARLTQLRERQIQLCIEDFGMGYSRLNYLHQFPIHALKIDRAFVSEIDRNSDKAETARIIVMLAHHLGMETIAEGIETKKQLETLREFGCEFAQGYFFSSALDAVSAEDLVLREEPIIEI
ncbi:EAL domain-containing protein [Lusitaniella coriacea LEGE 07157]|uniref:EAL domain-containing protein n=1 Tax=Lusitaniella coriacea LEGE 07157 TaxID=945747 RepID=A0A8J7B3N9_9CYAN|nr:bifunctional diguanylate cyclase/phosphodiesterase [Lusitaniella coriacea]MBE9115217.1 EAL domain-containing protein [Lusitaniella coriacea LEGE 07157]